MGGGFARAQAVTLGRAETPLLVQRPARLRVPLWAGVAAVVLRGLARGLRWAGVTCWRYPFTALAVLVAVVAVWTRTAAEVLVVAAVVGLVGAGVAWRRPLVWSRWVVGPAWRYRCRRRLGRTWARLCGVCGLALVETDRVGVRTSWTPSLSRLRWSGETKAVLTGAVAMAAGQTVEDLRESADRLAAATGARWCRVRQSGPNTADVAFLFGDPLALPVPPMPLPASGDAVDLAGVPVGWTETGDVWRLRVAGTHTLIAGATGAGKSSLVWSLLRGLAPAIGAGLVQVWAVDGKAGMELSPGRDLFSRFATDVDAAVDLLDDAVTLMRDRAAGMAGHARTHVASPDAPLIVVLVDEVALLTAYGDKKTSERATKALSMLATQGRAPGVVLIAALQDPRKEVLSVRNLFPTRIAMRLDSASETTMVLGEAAVENGAACHDIPATAGGVAYVKIDGRREPLRVRSAYLTDTDVTTLATCYPAPTTTPGDAAGTGFPASSAEDGATSPQDVP